MATDLMEYFVILAVITVYLVLAWLVAMVAQRRGRSLPVFAAISVLLTPLVGLIVLLIATAGRSSAHGDKLVRCPVCAEWIQPAAIKCRFCGTALTPAPPFAPPPQHAYPASYPPQPAPQPYAPQAYAPQPPVARAAPPAPQAAPPAPRPYTVVPPSVAPPAHPPYAAPRPPLAPAPPAPAVTERPPAPQPPAAPPQTARSPLVPPAAASGQPVAPAGNSQTAPVQPLPQQRPAAPVPPVQAAPPARPMPPAPAPPVPPTQPVAHPTQPVAYPTQPVAYPTQPIQYVTQPIPQQQTPLPPVPLTEAQEIAARIERMRHAPAAEHPAGFYEKVQQWLHHDDPGVREEAVRFFAKHCQSLSDAAPLLDMLTADQSVPVRRASAECLGGLYRATRNRPVNEKLADVARNADEEETVRAAAYAAIRRINGR